VLVDVRKFAEGRKMARAVVTEAVGGLREYRFRAGGISYGEGEN